MSEQELVLNVKELSILSLTCSNCGHGTIFDFKSSDYLEKMVSPFCSICKTELAVDLQEQLKAYRFFYDSMSACERVEFRVRVNSPEATAAESASNLQKVVDTAVQEIVAQTAPAHPSHPPIPGPSRGPSGPRAPIAQTR
jgi:ribosome-associated translation inhibitor RaiA